MKSETSKEERTLIDRVTWNNMPKQESKEKPKEKKEDWRDKLGRVSDKWGDISKELLWDEKKSKDNFFNVDLGL